MLDPKIIKPFFDYLDRTNEDKSWEEMGLVANAPPEAIKAYEEYKKLIKDINDNDDPSLY
jgi:hypothetical protein